MKDYIVRATAGDGQIRAFAATTGNLVEEARKRHDTSPVATAALGRSNDGRHDEERDRCADASDQR